MPVPIIMTSINISAGLLILLLIVLIYVAHSTAVSCDDYMYGFWAADNDTFCEESDIQSMLLFVGETQCGILGKLGTATRQCYLVIMDDVCNQGVTLCYRPKWIMIGAGKYCVSARVTFDDESLWPENVMIEMDVFDGCLKIHQGGVIYARLHKQHETTQQCKLSEDAELVI